MSVPKTQIRTMVFSSCGMTDAGFCGWRPPCIQPRNGSPGNSPRPADGTRLHATSFVTAIDAMARYSSDVFVPWASEIALLRDDLDENGGGDLDFEAAAGSGVMIVADLQLCKFFRRRC